MTNTPTILQFGNYQKIFDYFNHILFDDKISNCFLNFSREGKYTNAIFRTQCWYDANNIIHEISLNPINFRNDNPQKICATIVHEMCHAYQEECGKPGRNGYHNKEWAMLMLSIGLKPTNNKNPSLSTGDSICTHILPDGKFERAYLQMPEEFLLPFSCTETLIYHPPVSNPDMPDQHNQPAQIPKQILELITNNDPAFHRPQSTKVKYSCSCPGKEQKNLWGRPGLEGIFCQDCNELFIVSD